MSGASTGPGIGVVGLGFMGRTHLAAWQAAAAAGQACRIVALCDVALGDGDPTRRLVDGTSGNLGLASTAEWPAGARRYTRAADLFADPAVEVVSLATPTDSHVDLALAALAAGKHVLVEKPVALASADVARLAAAARASSRLVMPAFCMRFWPGWTWLLQVLAERPWGALRSLSLRRLSSRPTWNAAFYADPVRSGGALFDLHIHDADFVRAGLGRPAAVSTAGHLDHLVTLYHYAEHDACVTAEAGWDHAPGFGFRMEFLAVFEGATAEYVHGRPAPLVLLREGRSEELFLPALSGYDGECRAFLQALARGASRPPVTLGEAYATTVLLEAEAESLRRGGARVELPPP